MKILASPLRAALCFVASLLGLNSIALPCTATPNFPAVVQQFVGAAALPPCTICHNNPNGGLGTVTTPFGEYLRSRGLIPNDTTSLRNALSAAEAENHDSNGDGVSDIDALRAGLDPNGSAGDPLLPGFGCNVGHTTHWSSSYPMTLCLLLIASYLARHHCRRRDPFFS